MPTENRSSNTDPRDVFIRLNPLGLGEAELRKDSTGFEDQRTHSDYLLFLAGYRETHAEPQHHPEPIAWMVGTAFWWTKEEAERDAAATGKTITPFGPMTCITPSGQPKGDPVMRLECEKLWDGDGEYAVDFVKPGWLKECREKGGTFLLYTHADPDEVERLRAENERLRSGFYQEVTDADLKKIHDYVSDPQLPTGAFLRQDAYDLANFTAHMCREVQATRTKLAERDALLRDFLEVATGGFSDSDHVLRVRRRLETFLSASA